MALADHVCGALRRAKNGIPPVPYPLNSEIRSLYKREYQQGCALLAALNRRLDDALDPSESVAFALHFVNAGFSTGDLSPTYMMTGVIQQLLAVIESTYNIKLDEHSVNIAVSSPIFGICSYVFISMSSSAGSRMQSFPRL